MEHVTDEQYLAGRPPQWRHSSAEVRKRTKAIGSRGKQSCAPPSCIRPTTSAIENVPDAAIQEPTDAIIRITRACICGSDLWPYNGGPNVEGQQHGS